MVCKGVVGRYGRRGKVYVGMGCVCMCMYVCGMGEGKVCMYVCMCVCKYMGVGQVCKEKGRQENVG